MFPTQEAGDFLNDKFVLLKYELDVEDPEGIVEKYGVRGFPTFVILNEKGENVARFVGGSQDPKWLIAKINEVMIPENNLFAKRERYKNDPSYAPEYIAFLKSVYMDNEADAVTVSLFKDKSVAENFSKENVDHYAKNIKSIQSPIFQYMLANRTEIERVMGKDEYNKFIITKVNAFITSKIGKNNLNKEVLESALAEVGKQKALQTSCYLFVKEAKSALIANDFNAAVKVANKHVKKADSDSRQRILRAILSLAMDSNHKLLSEHKADYLKFATLCYRFENDPKWKETFRLNIESMKN